MKILYIDVNCKNSSTGKIVYDLYTECGKYGNEAAVCYGRGKKINEKNIFKFGIDIETYFHAMMTRLTGLTGYYSYFSTRRLLRFIDEFKPDVIHIYELHAYFVNIIPLIQYLKKKNIRTVMTFVAEFMYTGKCGHSYECDNWKNECGKCPQVKEYPSSLFFDFTRKMINDKKRVMKDFNNLVITVPSKWSIDRVRQSFLGDKDIALVFNGLDAESVFYPRNFQHLRNKHGITNEKIVLTVAPDIMSESKGGRHVLELAASMKDENIKFIFIGVSDLNEKFDDNVIALGRTENQQELAEYYSMADAFVMCSLKETFSMTCAEALCCGTPVVGFKSGAPETVFKEPYANFVDHGNIEELKKTLLSTVSQPKKTDEISGYGKGEFSKIVVFKKFLELYRV